MLIIIDYLIFSGNGGRIIESNLEKSILPKSIWIIVSSIVIYYWNIFFDNSSLYEKALILIAIISVIFFNMVLKEKKSWREVSKISINYKKIKRIGYLYIVIGLLSHIIFYLPNLSKILTYGDSYTLGRGNGYITVFFDFYVLGLLLLIEYYWNLKRKINGIFILSILTIPYILFYIFILMKRRQLILLGIGIMLICLNKWLLKRKLLFYIFIVLAYIVFSIFGKSRGAFDILGIDGGIRYIIDNFNLEWLSLSNFEGKYMTMILRDVIGYVTYSGLDVKVLLGAITIFIPRKLFGFKYLAFPEWYTYNFHPDMYIIGTGYAGSLVAEAYLIGQIPFIIFLFGILGVLSIKVDKLFLRGYKSAYAICVYIFCLLPRLDLGSIVIMLIFLLLPAVIAYKISSIRIEVKV